MYIPSTFAECDLPTLHAFVEANPLATLVTNSPADGLFATHLPLVLDRGTGSLGTLVGHLARANPHARHVSAGPMPCLAIFTGPQAYITPEWYLTKQQTGRVVPTWNYVAVHASGELRLRDDPAFLREHLEALTRQHEANRAPGWQVSDAPADYIERQMKAIVGVEIAIDRLEGKWKMSQNRPAPDIEGVIQGLEASGTAQNQAVAAIVRARRPMERGAHSDDSPSKPPNER
ncbi:MAG TPA: FMN-binding negative transcriptional regulator [Gemmatimonadaceae bacterium]|nr:FMN-binding negative transcriptional regulator [Gemmatimonadaceae bacterium]